MQRITLTEFLNRNLADFALYKLLTQIPNAIDGLTVTQRKVIWVLLNRSNKKHKTAQIHSYLLTDTKYNHGDIGAIATANNLAAKFKNNLNLVDPYGSFGVRTNPAPAQARYTEVKIADVSKEIFKSIDLPIIEKHAKQIFEGEEIEPYFLLPIIPLSIVNGNSGIAVGYSSQILGRNPVQVVDLLLKLLTKEIKKVSLASLKPWLPYFSGRIEQGQHSKQWVFYGTFERHSRNKKLLKITELPPGYSKESYEERVLIPLKEKGVIRSYNDNSVKNRFEYIVKFTENIDSVSDEKLIDILSLSKSVTENLTFIDRSENQLDLLVFDNILEYLKFWIRKRAFYYEERRQYIIERLQYDIKVLQEQMRFIEYVIDERIVVAKRTKEEIISQLEQHNFLKVNDSYDYLLNMRIYNLSKEKIDELDKKIENLQQELEKYRSLTNIDIWIDELKTIRPIIEKLTREKETHA